MNEPKIIKLPRQTKFLGIPDSDIEMYLSEVETTFGTEWLSDDKCEHRLQQLWARPDGNSTIELLSLGYGLATLRKHSPEWLNGCLGDIKAGESANTINGALFELNMMSWLINGGMAVEPASYAFPGLDATIQLKEGEQLLVSMKNFDLSNREKTFRENCEALRNKCRQTFGARGKPGVFVFLTAQEYFESKSDWKKIEGTIDRWPETDGSADFSPPDFPKTQLGVFQTIGGAGKLAHGFISDEFIGLIPWHEYEKDHFLRKVNDAIAEMKKACKGKTGKKACFIRVHQSADMVSLGQRANEIVTADDSGIDLILLYRVAYVADLKENTTFPSFYVALVGSKSWEMDKNPINLKPLIATGISKPSRLKLTNGTGQLVDLPPNHYFYSAAQHFVEVQRKNDGTYEHNCTRRPNLSIYPMVEGTPIVGLLPPNDEFLIL